MEVTQKMQLFYTYQGKSRSDWHGLMEDVHYNFESFFSTGLKAIKNVNRLYVPGFWRLHYSSNPFMRCMLKWCVEEDGTINRDFVEILTDVETHIADVTRFIIQRSEAECYSFDGKDFSKIDHLLPRMAKACQHVWTAEFSPPNFNISFDSLDTYRCHISRGISESRGSAPGAISIQVTKLLDLMYFVNHSTDTINKGNDEDLLIYLEFLCDKLSCHVFYGCWGQCYNMYLSDPSFNIDKLFLVGIQKITALHLDVCPVATWTDKILEAYIDYAQTSFKQLQKYNDSDLTRPVKDQLEKLRRELGITVRVHTSFPPQLPGSNLVDARVEVQALAWSIESLSSSYFTTQTEDINVVVAFDAEMISLGLQNLLSSITKDWVMQLTSCTSDPLTHEFLIELMERVQRLMCRMVNDNNIIRRNPVNDQLKMLYRDLESFMNFHVDYPQGFYAEHRKGLELMVEVQTMATNIKSFIYSFFTQTEDIELVVSAAVEK